MLSPIRKKGLETKKTQHELHMRDDVCDNDRETIRSLARSTGVFREEEVTIACELLDERLTKGYSSGYYFLFAEIGKKVVGFTIFGPIPFTEESYDIYWIVVDKLFHGQKIGSSLLQATESKIKMLGGKRVYIETSSTESYKPTRYFYRSRGYKKEAVLNNFYREGDSKVIFLKIIETSKNINRS
jgi:ribosomal protein S18 acetylase RimI-like enzyme